MMTRLQKLIPELPGVLKIPTDARCRVAAATIMKWRQQAPQNLTV